MILATRFTFIVERSWKNMYFHPKLAWPPATYDVISRNHSNWPSLNLSQNVREGWTNRYWKRHVLMFYPRGKKLKKNLGGSTPFPPPCTYWGQRARKVILVYMQDRGFNSFASNMIKLSVNEPKRSSLLALTRALFRSEYLILGPKSYRNFRKTGPRVLKSPVQLSGTSRLSCWASNF